MKSLKHTADGKCENFEVVNGNRFECHKCAAQAGQQRSLATAIKEEEERISLIFN